MPASLQLNPGPPKAIRVGDRLALTQRGCLSAREKPGVRKRQRMLSFCQLKTIAPEGTAVPGGLQGYPLPCSRGFNGTQRPGIMHANLQTSDGTKSFVLFPPRATKQDRVLGMAPKWTSVNQSIVCYLQRARQHSPPLALTVSPSWDGGGEGRAQLPRQ